MLSHHHVLKPTMCQVMYRLGYKRVETLPVPLELTVKGLLSPENSLLWGWAQVWEPERMKRTLPVDWGEKGIPVQFSHSVTSNSLRPHGLQHARLSLPSPTHVHWVSDAIQPSISSSVIPFSSCPQSCPASGYFQMSQLFASGGQSIGVSASTPVLPMNIQDWFPLGWTGWISLLSKGHLRVFSSTTVQNYQFFRAQLSFSPTLTSIHDYWKNYSFD